MSGNLIHRIRVTDVVAALAVTVVVFAVTAVAATAGSGPGFVSFSSSSAPNTADNFAGFDVYVVHSGVHAPELYSEVKQVVAEQRSYGMNVRFAGWGDPGSRSGTIRVHQARPAARTTP